MAGLGAVILHLFPGDRVEVVDREGRQVCDVVAFGAGGKPDLEALDLKAGRPRPASTDCFRAGAGAARRSPPLRQRGIPAGDRLGSAGAGRRYPFGRERFVAGASRG